MRHLRFTKMQAYGNDYVYMDAIRQDIPDPNGLARRVSDRHFGIGSDGLVLICPSEKGEFRMRMFNPDGTEGEMCGNALRSLSKFVYDHRLTDREHFFVETLGGLQEVWLTVEGGEAVNITADIGVPRLAAAQVPVATGLERFIDQPVQVLDRTFRLTALSWGNRHRAGHRPLPPEDQRHLRPGDRPRLPEDAGVGAGHRGDHRLRHRLLHRRGGRGPAGPVRPAGPGGADRRGAGGGLAHPGRPRAHDRAQPYRI